MNDYIAAVTTGAWGTYWQRNAISHGLKGIMALEVEDRWGSLCTYYFFSLRHGSRHHSSSSSAAACLHEADPNLAIFTCYGQRRSYTQLLWSLPSRRSWPAFIFAPVVRFVVRQSSSALVCGAVTSGPPFQAPFYGYGEREGGEGVNSLVKICTKTDTRQVKETIPLATTCLA
jgi:hypothetical protein